MEKSLETREVTTNASPVLRTNDTTIPETNVEVDHSQDGTYSWICVVCVFLINMHTFGINGVSLLIPSGNEQPLNY
jgi:peptide methionine sulfoxide reductase MsrB